MMGEAWPFQAFGRQLNCRPNAGKAEIISLYQAICMAVVVAQVSGLQDGAKDWANFQLALLVGNRQNT